MNLLTGKREELVSHLASHMDVNATVYCGQDKEQIKMIDELGSENLKRILIYKKQDWFGSSSESPYFIEKTQEVKTTWHPTAL